MRRAMILGLVAVAGCTEMEPYNRAGMWQPTGANTLNLAAMVANPRDLIRGRGTVGTPAIEAVPPVNRYWSGRVVALPTTSSQSTGTGQGRAATASGGSGGGNTGGD